MKKPCTELLEIEFGQKCVAVPLMLLLYKDSFGKEYSGNYRNVTVFKILLLPNPLVNFSESKWNRFVIF